MKRSRVAMSLAAAGVVGIFGGEVLCIAGPLRYERQVHLVCHAILYVGIACMVAAAAVHWGTRHDSGPRP